MSIAAHQIAATKVSRQNKYPVHCSPCHDSRYWYQSNAFKSKSKKHSVPRLYHHYQLKRITNDSSLMTKPHTRNWRNYNDSSLDSSLMVVQTERPRFKVRHWENCAVFFIITSSDNNYNYCLSSFLLFISFTSSFHLKEFIPLTDSYYKYYWIELRGISLI